MESKIISSQKVFESKWLGIRYVDYSIGDKVLPRYEAVFLPQFEQSKRQVNGVDIVPILKKEGKKTQIVMIANFRPPVGKFVLEFPAGIAENEDYQQNAKRELLEETGFVASKILLFPRPRHYSDPWKSYENGFLYLAQIDGNDPAHFQKQELDAEENIIVHLFDLDYGLPQKITQFAKENNYEIQSKVLAVCVGLALAQMIK